MTMVNSGLKRLTLKAPGTIRVVLFGFISRSRARFWYVFFRFLVTQFPKRAPNHSLVRNEMSVLTSRLQNVWSQIKQIYMSNLYPLEVVGRGNQTQLQVGENLIYLINRFKS